MKLQSVYELFLNAKGRAEFRPDEIFIGEISGHIIEGHHRLKRKIICVHKKKQNEELSSHGFDLGEKNNRIHCDIRKHTSNRKKRKFPSGFRKQLSWQSLDRLLGQHSSHWRKNAELNGQDCLLLSLTFLTLLFKNICIYDWLLRNQNIKSMRRKKNCELGP